MAGGIACPAGFLRPWPVRQTVASLRLLAGHERRDGLPHGTRPPYDCKCDRMNSLDEIIELYKRDVDVSLLDEMLRLTVEQRILRLEEFEHFREELRAATERASDALR